MKVNVIQTAKEWNGKDDWTTPANRCQACGQGTEEATLTLRSMCLTVLTAQRQDETLKPEDRFERFNLGVKIQQEDEPDLTKKEAVLLQELIMATFTNNLIACQAHQMLEG